MNIFVHKSLYTFLFMSLVYILGANFTRSKNMKNFKSSHLNIALQKGQPINIPPSIYEHACFSCHYSIMKYDYVMLILGQTLFHCYFHFWLFITYKVT